MKKLYFILVVSLVCLWGCSNDEVDTSKSAIIPDKEFSTPFDLYLHREFREAYNIEFLYRLSDIETRLEFDLIPTSYANSVQMANVIKYFCLEPYSQVVSKEFVKENFPKMLLLIGSYAYKKNGKQIEGEAEGGNKIALFNVNSLKTNKASSLLTGYLKTIYHEFSHILHQKKDYPTEFRQLTASKYNGDSWTSVSDNQALKEGFISAYSMKDTNEDFAELIAHYIINTETQWEAKLNSASTGRPIIEQKIEMVKNYLLSQWEVDLDALRQEIQTRGENISSYDFNNIN